MLLGVTSLLISFLFVAWLRGWARKRELLDIPNTRSSHTQPTPRGGGLAIVLVTLVGVMVFNLLIQSHLSTLWPYLAGSILIALVSWIDDLISLPFLVRLPAHFLGAIFAVWGFGHIQDLLLPLLDETSGGWLGVLLSLFWIVGLTNAYNFMDGIDGLAGSQAIIAGLGTTLLGLLVAQPLLTVIGLLLTTSSLGFLVHNWPPAHIFMGDVGSAFLGYSFAVLALIAAQADPKFLFAYVLLLWPFLFDTAFTLFQRLRRQENIFAAHRSHLYQRLVIIGYSHRCVTLLYSALAITGLVLTYTFVLGYPIANWLILLGLPLTAVALVFFVNLKESGSRRAVAPHDSVES